MNSIENKLIPSVLFITASLLFPLIAIAADEECERSYCDDNPTAEECLQCPERPGCPGGGEGGDCMDTTISE